MFKALRARTWVLIPGVITSAEGPAKANIFETPVHYVVVVGLGGKQNSANIKLRGIAGTATVLYPGETAEMTLQPREQGDAIVFDVPLKRGCAMLLLAKADHATMLSSN